MASWKIHYKLRIMAGNIMYKWDELALMKGFFIARFDCEKVVEFGIYYMILPQVGIGNVYILYI
jgi:hypothetical protein